jgi:hypothetical protein
VNVLSYTIRCYRATPGDANCPNVPLFSESLKEAIGAAGDMLLAYHNSPKRHPALKPWLAQLEDERGEIVARVRVVGPDAVERIAA